MKGKIFNFLFLFGFFSLVWHGDCLFVGINIDPSNPAGSPTPTQVKGLGATSVRIEYKDTAPAGYPPSAFPFYDPIIDGMVSNNISVLLILDYMSLVGRPSSSSGSEWDTYTKEFASRCGSVAAHYAGKVFAYEVWNEEDLTTVGNVDPSTFGPLLQSSYEAIHSADPNSTVIMGGLASGNPGYVTLTQQVCR
jgi:hypothetical protein